MATEFGLEEDKELDKEEGSGSNLSAVLKSPAPERSSPAFKRDIKGEIKNLLISADKNIQRRKHKQSQADVRKAMKLLEEL